MNVHIPTVFFLRKVSLGTWGFRYAYNNLHENISGQFKAADRDAAKRKIRKLHPGARFWR